MTWGAPCLASFARRGSFPVTVGIISFAAFLPMAWLPEMELSEEMRGIPPPPRIFGVMGLARNSSQNPDVKELRGQNP